MLCDLIKNDALFNFSIFTETYLWLKIQAIGMSVKFADFK